MYIGNPVYQVAFLTDQFSGDNSTKIFTMSVAPANTASVLVAVGGVLQDPSTYSVSGTTLTFSAAPPTGTGNISARYLGIPASNVTTTAYRTVTEFTATASQTTFTPPSYTVGFISVYRNGVRLGSADYTASNGTTVVLTNAATAGDLVTTESFLVSSVLNAIPNTAGSVGQSNLAGNVGATGPAFSAYGSALQSIPNGAYTKIAYNTKEFDTNNNYDATTNYRFTPSVAGYYQINAGITISAGSGIAVVSIYKNGTGYKNSAYSINSISTIEMTNSAIAYLNGSTDYVEIYTYQSSGGNLNCGSAAIQASFQAAMVRSA